jgi:hypothetical protein
MRIKFSLSGFIRGVKFPELLEIKEELIGIPVYLDRYKHVGKIVEVDPDSDSVYAEVADAECDRLVLDAKGYNMCSFEIAKE